MTTDPEVYGAHPPDNPTPTFLSTLDALANLIHTIGVEPVDASIGVNLGLHVTVATVADLDAWAGQIPAHARRLVPGVHPGRPCVEGWVDGAWVFVSSRESDAGRDHHHGDPGQHGPNDDQDVAGSAADQYSQAEQEHGERQQ